MYCVKCGAQNEDNAKFCTSCGAPLEETAAEETVAEETAAEETVAEETVAEEATAEEATAEEATAEEATAEEVTAEEIKSEETPVQQVEEIQAEQIVENKKSGLIKKIIIGVVVLVALIGIIFGCKLLFGGSKNKEVTNEKLPVMYIKDEDVYYLNAGSKKPYKLTDEYAGDYAITDDGKRIFFADDKKLDGEFKLYYRVASQKTPKGKNADDKGIKIASGVNSFTISSKGDFVIYKKGDKLCISNLKEERVIAKDTRSYYLSEDNKWITYYDDEGDLYVCGIGKKDKAQKIDSDVSYIAIQIDENKKLYYVKDEKLYSKQLGKDKVKIADDVDDIFEIDENYFVTVKQEKEYSFKDLFDDDCLASDNQMIEPDYEDFRMESEYYYYSPIDWDAYYEARDKYDEKESRDRVREYYSENPVTVTTYTLNKLNGNKLKKIADNVVSVSGYSQLVKQVEGEDGISKIKMSTITNYYEVSDMLSDIGNTDDVNASILLADGTLCKISDYDSRGMGSIEVSEDGKYMYCIEYDEDNGRIGELNRYTIAKSGTKDKKKIYDDVSNFSMYDELLLVITEDSVGVYENNKYVELSDYEDSNLCAYKDGILYYVVDVDEDSDCGTLMKYENGKKKQIDTDVYANSFTLRGAKKAYYLKDYSTKKSEGDLYFYKGGKPKLIDSEVSGIIN